MKVCIAGKNNIAVEIAQHLISNPNFNNDSLIIVCNQTDDGKDGWQRSLLKFANENNIMVKRLADLYEYKRLVFLSLEFDKIIRPERFKSTKLFNIHFSFLPKYRGMYTSIWPILNNEKETACDTALHQ